MAHTPHSAKKGTSSRCDSRTGVTGVPETELAFCGLLDRRDMAMLLPVVAAAAAVLRAGSVGDAPPMLELDYSLLPEAP